MAEITLDRPRAIDPTPWPEPRCCMGDSGCICPTEERALRGWMRGDPYIRDMSEDQREWCLREIERVEGHYREDHEGISNDAELARGVLNAWTDYCRDKGLL